MARFEEQDEGSARALLSGPGEGETQRVAQLTRDERMFLSVLRHRLVGMAKRNPAYWEAALRQIARRSGGERKLIFLTALEELLQTIARWPQRTLYIHPPCRAMLTPDEMLLLGLIGAAQAGDEATAKAIAERLVSAGAESMVVAAASELGDMTIAAGIILAVRSDNQRDEVVERSSLEPVGRALH